MANTGTVAGSVGITASLAEVLAGDQSGQIKSAMSATLRFAAAASLPDIAQASGFLYGKPVCAAGDWLLAHLTDPFNAMGDAVYPGGFSPAAKKIKAIIIRNLDATNSITIARGTLLGLPIFSAADDAITIPAGGLFVLTLPAGSAAITTGVNDKLTIAVGGGTPQAEVLVVYGT